MLLKTRFLYFKYTKMIPYFIQTFLLKYGYLQVFPNFVTRNTFVPNISIQLLPE